MQWLWFKYLNTPSQGSTGSAREGDIAIAMLWFSYNIICIAWFLLNLSEAINHFAWVKHESVKTFTLCLLTSISLHENICHWGRHRNIERPEHVFEGHTAFYAPLRLEELLDVVVKEVLPDVRVSRHPLHVIHIHTMEHQAVPLRLFISGLGSWGLWKIILDSCL